MLSKVALVLKCVDETLLHVTIQTKAIEQHFHVVMNISKATAAQVITIRTEPHVCAEIENHATLFSCSTWLEAWITTLCHCAQ